MYIMDFDKPRETLIILVSSTHKWIVYWMKVMILSWNSLIPSNVHHLAIKHHKTSIHQKRNGSSDPLKRILCVWIQNKIPIPWNSLWVQRLGEAQQWASSLWSKIKSRSNFLCVVSTRHIYLIHIPLLRRCILYCLVALVSKDRGE